MAISTGAFFKTNNDSALESKVKFFIHLEYFNNKDERIGELKTNISKEFDRNIPQGSGKIYLRTGVERPDITMMRKEPDSLQVTVKSDSFTTISAMKETGEKISDLVFDKEPFLYKDAVTEVSAKGISLVKVTATTTHTAKALPSKNEVTVCLEPDYVQTFEIKSLSFIKI